MELSRLIRPILFRLVNKRCVHTSPVSATKEWRNRKGLPENKMSYGPLTDLPDYTYLDGRPTPIGGNQKRRMYKQQEYTKKIISVIAEVDFAVQHLKDLQTQKEEEKQRIIGSRLKPKGKYLKPHSSK